VKNWVFVDRLNNAALINRLSGSDSSGLPNFDPDYSDPGNHIQGALELSALETEGKGEVISTPRVITTNQKEAVIQKGVEIPYEQATSSGATSVQFKKAVLELRVTPLITPDDRIETPWGNWCLPPEGALCRVLTRAPLKQGS